MADVVNTNQFKNGMHIEIDGAPWRIVEFQHVKPGKGGAFVRTKLKALESGAVVDKTFRAGEKFSRVHTEVKNVQYLYDAGDEVIFMDEETYEQMHLPRGSVEDALEFLEPSSTVQLLMVDRKPAGVQLPASVELAVTDTEPGVRGDTASGGVTKLATLSTGLEIRVPLFIKEGERVKVHTETREFAGRA
jgi:elongation factor P